MRLATTVPILATVMLASCGHIQFYTDAALTEGSETGILYYPPKPYLLVSRTGAKDKPTDVQVIYLPDLSQPRYAVMRPGLGSSNLGLTFSNGVLVSANQETDPKIAEAVTALAGVPLQLANSAATRATAAETRAGIRAEASDLPLAATGLTDVARDIETIASETNTATVLNGTRIIVLRGLPPRVREVAALLNNPSTTPSNLDGIVATLEDIEKQLAAVKASDNPGEATLPVWARIREVETRLTRIIGTLKPTPTAPPTLTLYEIIMDGEGTRLREVPMSLLG